MNQYSVSSLILCILIVSLLIDECAVTATQSFQMITQKQDLLDAIKKQPISVFFYGSSNTQEYSQFEKMLPSDRQVFPGLEFYFLPSDKFKLARPNPSISIFRRREPYKKKKDESSQSTSNQNNGEWLVYNGVHRAQDIANWVRKNCNDPLTDLEGDVIESYFVDGKKGFILLDFGQMHLLRVKILLGQFCEMYKLTCGKVTQHNPALGMVVQLMRAEGEPGVSKLAFWNPKTQQFEIFTRDLYTIKENDLMQLYSGHEGIMPYKVQMDVAQVIHPETIILEEREENDQEKNSSSSNNQKDNENNDDDDSNNRNSQQQQQL